MYSMYCTVRSVDRENDGKPWLMWTPEIIHEVPQASYCGIALNCYFLMSSAFYILYFGGLAAGKFYVYDK
jgi:hypothetical protein